MPELSTDDLVALETAVWQAFTDSDAEADAHLLSHDFFGVYPSGWADRDASPADRPSPSP